MRNLDRSCALTASDPDGDSLAYRATGLPDTASFDADRAKFAWTPAVEDVGTHAVAFEVSDGGAAIAVT